MHKKYNTKSSGISRQEKFILDTMVKLGISVIRATALEHELGYTRKMANLSLSRLTKKGWLQRLAPGIYRPLQIGEDTTSTPEDSWAIAMELFSPCYISGWTAAEHWELTEQVFNTTVVFTTKKQRRKEIVISGLRYTTKFISQNKIFGIKKIWSSNTQIQIADIHRTIIDILYDPKLGGGGRQTIDIVKAYVKHKTSDQKILYDYSRKLNSSAVYKRLGFLMEKLLTNQPIWLKEIHNRIKSGIINLDPAGPNAGQINTKWGIRINIPSEDLR